MVYIPGDAALRSFDEKVKALTHDNSPRSVRSPCGNEDAITSFALLNSTGIGILFAIISIVLLLLVLGLIKGLLGLYCFPPVGMCGLGALIDLPRPLRYYQESDLADYKVKYDVIGWPVHPQTGKRTVRALSLRTEFCLNVIFFLTYPIVMLITLLSFCCFHKVYDSDDSNTYKRAHTIMLTNRPSVITKIERQNNSCKKSSYYTDDSAEENDTKYVLEQMRTSEESLKGRN